MTDENFVKICPFKKISRLENGEILEILQVSLLKQSIYRV